MTNQEAAKTLRQMAAGVRPVDMAACLTGAASLERAECRRANDDEIAYMMGARPARVICPDNQRDQECEGCYHSVPHDKNDGCGPNTGNNCPACREVKP